MIEFEDVMIEMEPAVEMFEEEEFFDRAGICPYCARSLEISCTMLPDENQCLCGALLFAHQSFFIKATLFLFGTGSFYLAWIKTIGENKAVSTVFEYKKFFWRVIYRRGVTCILNKSEE